MNRQTVAQTNAKAAVVPPPARGLLQRACACGQHTGGGECEECRKKTEAASVAGGSMQRAAVNREPVNEVPPIVYDVLRSPGRPLDSATRAFFEPRLGHDFSQVRVHADAKAAESAGAVDALAYTVGRDIVFGAGQYAPRTSEGRRLLAHELTHVAQQNVSTSQDELKVDQAADPAEREAEAAALFVMNNRPVTIRGNESRQSLQRALICARPLDIPVLGSFFNHAFANDPPANYAIRGLVSGTGMSGCATTTDASGPPDDPATSTCKPCNPKPGQTAVDVSSCLRNTHLGYPSPNIYRNLPDPRDSFRFGPNSNTYAATLARCCDDSSDSGLGRVPGWNHSPALPCPSTTLVAEEVSHEGAPGPGPSPRVPAAPPAAVPCPHPINWTHTNPRDHGADGIRIDIAWDSSTGNLPDLTDCTVREVVNYDPIPNPPFLWNPPNPTILTVPGVNGVAMDTHSYPPGLRTGITNPRQNGTATANQVYQYRCTGSGCSGMWTDFPGQTYAITREVFAEFVRLNPWRYRITKEATGTGNAFKYSREVEIPPP